MLAGDTLVTVETAPAAAQRVVTPAKQKRRRLVQGRAALLQGVVEIAVQTSDMASYVAGSEYPKTTEVQACVDVADMLAPASADIAAHEAVIVDESKSFSDQLLRALATMAVRSKRRQADLSAALARSGLDTDPGRITEALRHLETIGCIEQLVPLYDGGVLMSVTSRGVETLNAGPRWTMLSGAGLLL